MASDLDSLNHDPVAMYLADLLTIPVNRQVFQGFDSCWFWRKDFQLVCSWLVLSIRKKPSTKLQLLLKQQRTITSNNPYFRRWQLMNFETVIGLGSPRWIEYKLKIFSPTSAHFGNEQMPIPMWLINLSSRGASCLEQGCWWTLVSRLLWPRRIFISACTLTVRTSTLIIQRPTRLQFDEPPVKNGWDWAQLEDGSRKSGLNSLEKMPVRTI